MTIDELSSPFKKASLPPPSPPSPPSPLSPPCSVFYVLHYLDNILRLTPLCDTSTGISQSLSYAQLVSIVTHLKW